MNGQAGAGRKLHHLQALRGIAANLVVLDHISSTLIKYGHISDRFQTLFWHLGDIGVSIFFVISGFIMTYTSHGDMGRPGAARLFLEKRLIRVVPLYWCATIVMFAMLMAAGKPDSIGNLLKSLFFLPYYGEEGGVIRPVLGQGWTINYEIFFYALFAISLGLRAPRSFYFLSILFGALVLAGRIAGTGGGASWRSYTDPIILLFLAGVLMGWLWTAMPHLKGVRRPLPGVAALLILDALVFFCFPASMLAKLSCALLAAAMVALCILAPEGKEGRIARLWESLGDGSYSTYLFHGFWLAALNRLLHLSGAPQLILYSLTALIGANIVGILLYHGVERPLTLSLRRLLVRRAGQ